jgi:hypothetical protein
MTDSSPHASKPAFRQLRGYAFDPSLSLNTETAGYNQIVYKVAWEDLGYSPDEKAKVAADRTYQPQGPGPIGEYIEVLDYDPTTGLYYEQVDLNEQYPLSQQGFEPSESNPLFHQQMVYAVIMITIKNFERALGRKVIWSPRRLPPGQGYYGYVQRLRVYPHAFREANAYYSPQKKALLFGYFSASPADRAQQMPDSLVFTCLSHDIIAHETTHAILDGIHNRYNEPSNPDVLAFHEAFADIVALFQHFTFPEVLRQQIARTKGSLDSQNLLGQLAQQVGSAIGGYGSLRDALGAIDEKTHQWTPRKPNIDDYQRRKEPHALGSILVDAIFEAFINIYKSRVADLLRIASNGTGILPQGELHPDLVNRLAQEAARSASHVLNMCIRALDYCPPVDINFGDFLRAIITADLELVADDPFFYRLHFIDAFRRRGIYPEGIKTLSVESLRFTAQPVEDGTDRILFRELMQYLKEYRNEIMYQIDRKTIYDTARYYLGNTRGPSLHDELYSKFAASPGFEALTGLILGDYWKDLGISESPSKTRAGQPSFQVDDLRAVSRIGPEGRQVNQIIFSIVQVAGVLVRNGEFKGHFQPRDNKKDPPDGIRLYGGCTLIFDLDKNELQYAIARPLLDLERLPREKPRIDRGRIQKLYDYQLSSQEIGLNEFSRYFGIGLKSALNEPFALLHQG